MSFTDRELCDTKKSIEGMFALSSPSREEVDQLVAKAVSLSAKQGKTQDHGFMYSLSFDDLDGHHWEVVWMNPQQAQ